MKKITKFILIIAVIIGGTILNYYTPKEFKYILGFTMGSIAQTISFML